MPLSTLIETLTKSSGAPAQNGHHQPTPAPQVYVPNPNLREDDSVAAPPFPMDVLPERLRRVVEDCEKYMSFPPEITAASILASAALAIGRTCQLYYQGEWRECACLYMAIVAPPGSAKSHPLKFALDPIIRRNKEAIRDYSRAQRDLAERGEVTENLKDRQCLFSDFTIEALTRAVQKNPRGIGVYIDELRAWFQNFNRYNTGSEQEFWLQNWSGMSMAITRMTKKAWLERPSIPVVGTIQPSLLEDIGKGGRAQNGFAERMLYIYPDVVPVLRLKTRLERTDTAYIMQRNYAPIINHLLDRNLAIEGQEDTDDEPWTITLEPSADDILTGFINILKEKMESLDNEYLRNVYSKMQTYTLRFALILNRLEEACAYQTNADFPPADTMQVTAEQAIKATMLTEYFLGHAFKANNIINAQSPLAKLPKDELNFYRAMPFGNPFTTMDAERVAERYRISRAKLFRMLNETDMSRRLFTKIRHGEYERLYV